MTGKQFKTKGEMKDKIFGEKRKPTRYLPAGTDLLGCDVIAGLFGRDMRGFLDISARKVVKFEPGADWAGCMKQNNFFYRRKRTCGKQTFLSGKQFNYIYDFEYNIL
jgi:hypothetical protein